MFAKKNTGKSTFPSYRGKQLTSFLMQYYGTTPFPTTNSFRSTTSSNQGNIHEMKLLYDVTLMVIAGFENSLA